MKNILFIIIISLILNTFSYAKLMNRKKNKKREFDIVELDRLFKSDIKEFKKRINILEKKYPNRVRIYLRGKKINIEKIIEKYKKFYPEKLLKALKERQNLRKDLNKLKKKKKKYLKKN